MFLLLYQCIDHVELSLLIGSYIYLVILSIYNGGLLSLIIPLDLFFFQKQINRTHQRVSKTDTIPISSKLKLETNISKENIVIPPEKEAPPYSQCSLGMEDMLEFTKINLGLNHINVSCHN